MVDIYELLRRDQDGTSEYVRNFLDNLNIAYNIDDYGNIFYLEHENVPLLSAHMDTVRKDADFCIGAFLTESDSDKIFSGGILGGDDKCGVYIILKALEDKRKVNFIFSRDEEIGCLGIKALLKPNYAENKENTDKIRNNCLYCLVLDRRGNSDIICTKNSYGTKKFEEALIKVSDLGHFGYKSENGLCSDANTIREFVSTANLSVGYFKPHSQNEYIVKADLQKAYDYTLSIIDSITDKFEPEKYTYNYNYNHNNYNKNRYGGKYYYGDGDYGDDYYGDYYGYYYGYYNSGGKKKEENEVCKCEFCNFKDDTEQVVDLMMPNGTMKKICFYCLSDLMDECKKALSKFVT